MIGYLTGESLRKLKETGATLCLYSTSTTTEWLGDLTGVYFFNKEGEEIAHQTMLSGECGIPEIEFYNRKWGDCIKRQYQTSQEFHVLLNSDLVDSTIYRVI